MLKLVLLCCRCWVKMLPQVHGIAVTSYQQVRVVSIGNLLSTTKTNQLTQSTQNNSGWWKLKVSSSNLLRANRIDYLINDKNLRLGFTALLCHPNNELEHANLPTQTIEMEGLQVEMHLCLLLKVDRLTKIILVIYFHETRITKP